MNSENAKIATPSREVLKKLINKGIELQKEDAKATTADCAKWTQDVRTYNERNLQTHPAYKPIHDALFFCNIRSILGYLRSVYDDFDLWQTSEREGDVNLMIDARQQAKYDVFISHANADKNNFVNELKYSLDKLGVTVFYDKDTLEWGDNWKDKILEGVEKAEFAIIVISENFFGRDWTEKELSEFLVRQNRNGQKIILPILYGITIEQLRTRYPQVAEIQALDSTKYTYDEIALKFAAQLIKRLKS